MAPHPIFFKKKNVMQYWISVRICENIFRLNRTNSMMVVGLLSSWCKDVIKMHILFLRTHICCKVRMRSEMSIEFIWDSLVNVLLYFDILSALLSQKQNYIASRHTPGCRNMFHIDCYWITSNGIRSPIVLQFHELEKACQGSNGSHPKHASICCLCVVQLIFVPQEHCISANTR